MENCIPRQKPDYRLQELDGELLLYHLGNSTIMYCNQSASTIWQLCDGKRSVNEMVALLTAAYDYDPQIMASEVTAVLDAFAKHKVIEFVDEAGQVVIQVPASSPQVRKRK